MVVAQTAEPLAVPLARACSFPVEGPTCMTLSCLCGRALLVSISLRLVLRTGSARKESMRGRSGGIGLFVLSVVSVCRV